MTPIPATTQVTLRPARGSDRHFFRSTLSDAEVQVWLGGYDTHWPAHRFHIPPVQFVLVACDPDGRQVAFVDALACPDHPGEAEVCVAVSPSARGAGIGQATMRALAAADLPFWALRAKVHPYNAASRGMLQACGYTPQGMCGDKLLELYRLAL